MSNEKRSGRRPDLPLMLPQEIRDRVALCACNMEVAVAVCATSYIQSKIRTWIREQTVNKLEQFMAGGFAKDAGMVHVATDESEETFDRANHLESTGWIGGWSLLEDHRYHFIQGRTDIIEITYNESFVHINRHYDAIGSYEAGMQEACECLEIYAASLLLLGGYRVDLLETVRLRVTGMEKTTGASGERQGPTCPY
jgi:hypothetical protein